MRKKRILAVLMAVLMIVTLLPSMAFAAEAGELGGKLKVKGLPAVVTVLSADYSKVTPEGVTDDDVIFSWSRQTGEKELTQVGTEKTYTVTQDDLGYVLVLDITPAETSGFTGKLQAKTLEVAATQEEAQAAADKKLRRNRIQKPSWKALKRMQSRKMSSRQRMTVQKGQFWLRRMRQSLRLRQRKMIHRIRNRQRKCRFIPSLSFSLTAQRKLQIKQRMFRRQKRRRMQRTRMMWKMHSRSCPMKQ